MFSDIRLRKADMPPKVAIPTSIDLSQGLYFRHLALEPEVWETHAHDWGQFNYLTRGVMRLEIAGRTFLSPPHYAVWIPPNVEHFSVNDMPVSYRSVYLSAEMSAALPAQACAMTVSPVLRAILDAFSDIDVRVPETPPQRRMAQVALDEIRASTHVDAYLPPPSSELMQAVLQLIESDPGKRLTTQWLAARFNVTERTLERRCRADLGIGLGEWQQRIRFMRALARLDAGESVKRIAAELGYASPSVFINMFRSIAGQTPHQYRLGTAEGGAARFAAARVQPPAQAAERNDTR